MPSLGCAGGDAEALRELLASSYRSTTLMPPAQAALLALRELPQCVADTVLARAPPLPRLTGG
jgi:hypothetical protein